MVILNIHFGLANHNIVIQLGLIKVVVFKLFCNNFIRIFSLN